MFWHFVDQTVNEITRSIPLRGFETHLDAQSTIWYKNQKDQFVKKYDAVIRFSCDFISAQILYYLCMNFVLVFSFWIKKETIFPEFFNLHTES